MIEKAIIYKLKNTVLSTVDATKVFVNNVPQDKTVPYAFIVRNATDVERTKDGAEMDESRVVINCVADNLDDAMAWGDEIRATLDELSETVNGYKVWLILCQDVLYTFLDDMNYHIATLIFDCIEEL